MTNEIFTALEALEAEKGIPKDYMMEKITQALLTAYKKDNEGIADNVIVDADEKTRTIRMYTQKAVVSLVEDPTMEISEEDARRFNKRAMIGDIVQVEIKAMNFGRIAAQTAKQVIIQGIREAEQGIMFQRFTSNEHELLPAVVSRIDPRNGNVILEMGGKTEKTEAVLPASEQVKGEVLKEGEHIRVYVVEVKKDKNRPRVLISRTHPGLVKRLFELQVPEIADGLVEIKSISREAGSRTKLAVYAQDAEIDPIGACVGPRGERVNAIVKELRGEKIDIIRYSEDMEQFVSAALAPATVLQVELNKGSQSCRAVVPDDQLSLAIGKEGQNARLAVKLTGYKIDIKSESQYRKETEPVTEESQEPELDSQVAEEPTDESLTVEE